MGKSTKQVLAKLVKQTGRLCAYCERPCDGAGWSPVAGSPLIVIPTA
jgi:hypothetical protein